MNYFEDEKAYLTQSGQLYNEADAMAFGKVYCFGPTFRAEKSKTRRHLTEFWMVEPEMAYATLEDVKRVGEELVVFVVGRVLENRRAELQELERDTSKLESVKSPFPRMSYDDAVRRAAEEGQRDPMGRRFRQHRRDADHRRFGPAADRGPVSHRDQSVLLRARSGAAGTGAGRGFYRAGRLRRDHRRRAAHSRSGSAAEASGRAQAAARGVRLVRGSAQVRQRAARRLRDGHRAFCGVDVRAGAHSRDHRVSADAVSHAAVKRYTVAHAQLSAQSRRSSPYANLHIAIIGAPLDLGAGRRGVDMGPSAVRVANLNGRLAELGYEVEDLGNVPVIQRESQAEVDSRAKYLPQIAETCTLVAEMVDEALAIGQVSAGAGRRPFHRGGNGVGRVAAFSSARRKAGLDLDRCAHRHEYAGQQPERQRARHAAGLLHRPGARRS